MRDSSCSRREFAKATLAGVGGTLLMGVIESAAGAGFDLATSASAVASALGNIGPCYISVEAMTELHPLVKITYIIGMLAGRLEILPILMLFSRRAWR